VPDILSFSAAPRANSARRIRAIYIKLAAYKISSEAGVKLPKIDLKRELILNLALLGSLITLIGGMALVIRISIGKW
jgi:hypothetical protein